MEDFSVAKTYLFTGSLNSIERKQEFNVKKEMLGRFISYFNIAFQNEYYENGKAEFEYGVIDFPYYHLIKEINE